MLSHAENEIVTRTGPATPMGNVMRRYWVPALMSSELPEPDGAPSWASRSATKLYRTSPLAGVWQHAPYFHNGSAATLDAVVETYNSRKALGLSNAQKADLVQFLKSL